MSQERPSSTTEEAVAAVRRAAPTVTFDPRVDLLLHKVDETDVCEWLADCSETEVVKHELDYKWPDRPHYHVVLHLEVETEMGDLDEFYLKVRLTLPNLTNGRVISFWPWDHRYD